MTGRVTSDTFHRYNPLSGYSTTSSYDRVVVYSRFQLKHCVKNALYSTFFWSVFSHIQTDYGDLICKSSYSVQMWEKSDQKNSDYGQFSRNGF